MLASAFGNALYRSRLSSIAMVLLTLVMLAAILTPPVAAQEPKPDPAGIATGDKNSVVDAAGTPFVVAEPTDKTASDYAEKKKAYDEFQAQLAKEPLAGKLADSVGHGPTPAQTRSRPGSPNIPHHRARNWLQAVARNRTQLNI